MKEYIERAVAIERARNELDLINKSHWSADEIVDFLKRLPAADVVEVRHGHWIDDKVSFYLGCSECGCFLEYAVDTFLDYGDHYNYCPNCGAKMTEVTTHEPIHPGGLA